MLVTWQFRVKDGGSGGRALSRAARAVNFVWNFAKATQRDALRAKSARIIADRKTGAPVAIPNFFSSDELDALVAGSSKELGLHSQTVQAITQEYARRRKQFGKLLRWRGKKSLGWVPWKSSGVKLEKGAIRYCGKSYRYFDSRPLPADAKVKCGQFSQDARGRWYISITFETEALSYACGRAEVGVDPGIKTLATLSDGTKIERPDLRAKYLEKLRRLERSRRHTRRKQAKTNSYGRLPKAKQAANLAAKVANQRRDYLHKESTKLVERASTIAMGDLQCAFMNRNRALSGISLDSGLGMFRAMLRYKALRAGATYREVSEKDSTQTCSSCGWKHPRERRIGLGVRHWTCGGCGAHHDRDINAARNILEGYLRSYLSEPVPDVVRRPPAHRKTRRDRESPTSSQAPWAAG
jgi:putative transposase